MAKIDWGSILDLEKAIRNLRIEIPGDWHQDPWGWPELGYLLGKEPSLVYQHCEGQGVQRVALLDVPKENWGTRPAVVLDILDRVIYQALVDKVSVEVVGDLSPNSFGWRLPAVEPKAGIYSHNNKQWDNYTAHMKMLGIVYDAALATDLVSFFASVPLEPVQEKIQDRTRKGLATNRLLDLIGSFQNIPDRSGLPQRSFASSVLANMYVTPLDDALMHHSSTFSLPFTSKVVYHSHTRWMDDMWLFCSDAAAARKAQLELHSVARSLGLHLNSAKTEVYEGDEVAKEALLIEHSAVDDAIRNDSDFTPLEELLDRLLEQPEKAGRTSVRFVAKRMRDHEHHYRTDDLIDLAERMPHVADVWARLFRKAFKSSALQDWYLDYIRSEWSSYEWSVAHFGRMFASARRPRKELRDFFADRVRDANTSLPLLTVASQRLCSWDPNEGRAACRDAYKRALSPHARRVIALAALGANETRTTVKNWLNVDKENYPTLQMLKSFNFAPPKVQPDFAG